MLTKRYNLAKLKEVKCLWFERYRNLWICKNIDIKESNVYVETEIVSSAKEVADELKVNIESAMKALGATRIDVVVKQPKGAYGKKQLSIREKTWRRT